MDAHPPLTATVLLSAVRFDLSQIEAIEDEVRLRQMRLRRELSAAQFRPVWALCDAEQRLALAERLLAERYFIERLIQQLPEHADAIRAVARDCQDEAGMPWDAV
ncbi:MAG: hypothetical protein IT305_05435 [Chloroflexi bacterium]|nr:hypothetical protein [Chloroflexota bacterium]